MVSVLYLLFDVAGLGQRVAADWQNRFIVHSRRHLPPPAHCIEPSWLQFTLRRVQGGARL